MKKKRRAHTLSRRVLPEVLGLVAAEEAGRLNLWGGAAGQLLVEVDHPLHSDSIRVGAKGLLHVSVPFQQLRRISHFTYPLEAWTTLVGRNAA